MALTFSHGTQGWMGPGRWRLLHAVGGCWVLVIFTNRHVGRLMEKAAIAASAVALIVMDLGLRNAAALKGHGAPQAA